MSKNSAIWKKTKLKSAMQEDHLRYVDAEGMRVITNSKHVAEQIKRDKDKSVAMDDPKIMESGKNWKATTFEERRDGWSKIWKSWNIGKLQS